MSGSRGAPRRRSREVALQVLYALDTARAARSGTAPPVEEVFERVAAHFDLPEGARAFAKELVCGVAAELPELDARIAEASSHWRLERMAVVDRNILRLGSFELTRTGTPHQVVIDEAVELAHRFGADASPAFVNGILDAVARGPAPAAEASR